MVRNIKQREAECNITLLRVNDFDIKQKIVSGYLLYYTPQAPNKKWLNTNKAISSTGTIILNHLILIADIIFFVKSLNHYELLVIQ